MMQMGLGQAAFSGQTPFRELARMDTLPGKIN
jgi:hypothetical protein